MQCFDWNPLKGGSKLRILVRKVSKKFNCLAFHQCPICFHAANFNESINHSLVFRYPPWRGHGVWCVHCTDCFHANFGGLSCTKGEDDGFLCIKIAIETTQGENSLLAGKLKTLKRKAISQLSTVTTEMRQKIPVQFKLENNDFLEAFSVMQDKQIP